MLGAPRRLPFGLQEGRKNQMFETLERNRAALGLRLEDRALQRCNQEARQLIACGFARDRANLCRGFEAIRDRLAHVLIDGNEALSDNFAMLAGLGAEVADETSVSPSDPIEILDLGINEGAQAVQRWKRVIAKSPLDHRAHIVEIEIEDLQAERFFRNEVIGERSLRHSRRLDDVAHARAGKSSLVHDTETFAQKFL